MYIRDYVKTLLMTHAIKEIFSIYKEQDSNGVLIDLRLNSFFFKKLSKLIAKSYLIEMDTMTESLVSKIHCEINDLKSSEPNDLIMTAVLGVIHHTLSIKAFSLEYQNSLLNISTIERTYLNSFVHLCFDAFLWYIANVYYEYEEITLKKHVNRNYADKYQLIYVEGSRPVTRNNKEINDLKKITSNLKMFAEIVKDIVKNRRYLPRMYRLNELSLNMQSELDLLKQENVRLTARIAELEQIAKEKNKLETTKLSQTENAKLKNEIVKLK
ncbi:hypothetical protein Glove_89g85 [Diversispora epigaea]|uniref:Uncharacterized protein n=1 Tax=Diversispora epigaea TaxID=1348612 RepID=A0A397JEN9_9GLOM|nr:hypothetical protein Glove_89g85 [Diversispora epigaea]